MNKRYTLIRESVRQLSTGKQSHFDHHLKPVANADDKIAVRHEFLQLVSQTMFDFICENRTRPQMVAKRESADESENIVSGQHGTVIHQIIQMNLRHRRTGQLKGFRSLGLAIQSDSGDDQSFYCIRH
jgi:hypothetical protein